MDNNRIKYSVICASKNEESDIIYLLESFISLNNNYKNCELIVIDDSNDNTPIILKKYAKNNKNIIYLNGKNEGCCQARNLGIRSCKGKYIVFMTADSFFQDDFLSLIDKYYSQGYDAVMVNSQVANLDTIWSIFLDCWHKEKLNSNVNFSPLTTQGYSVKKESALKVGLIDEGIHKPNICRDWTLIKKMDANKMKKIFVKDIFCNHFAPKNKSEFLYTHFTRGVISAGYARKFAHRSLLICFVRTGIKFSKVLFEFFVPFKPMKKTIGMLKYTEKKSRFFIFYCLYFLKAICFVFGELNTFVKYMFGRYI